MTSTTIVAALGTLYVIPSIVVALQMVKLGSAALKRPVPSSAYRPLAIGLGVLSALSYEVHQYGAADIPLALTVGISIGISALATYSALKGSFTSAELAAIEPLAQLAVNEVVSVMPKRDPATGQFVKAATAPTPAPPSPLT